METPKIVELLNDFAFNLESYSINRTEKEIKLILPIELYKELQYSAFQLSGMPLNTRDFIMKTTSNISFIISCKEIEDLKISEKLHECFNILSK